MASYYQPIKHIISENFNHYNISQIKVYNFKLENLNNFDLIENIYYYENYKMYKRHTDVYLYYNNKLYPLPLIYYICSKNRFPANISKYYNVKSLLDIIINIKKYNYIKHYIEQIYLELE